MSQPPPSKRLRTDPRDWDSMLGYMGPNHATPNAQAPRSMPSGAPLEGVPPMQNGSSMFPSFEPGSSTYHSAQPAPQPSAPKQSHEIIDLTDDADDPPPSAGPQVPSEMSTNPRIRAKFEELKRQGVLRCFPPPESDAGLGTHDWRPPRMSTGTMPQNEMLLSPRIRKNGRVSGSNG